MPGYRQNRLFSYYTSVILREERTWLPPDCGEVEIHTRASFGSAVALSVAVIWNRSVVTTVSIRPATVLWGIDSPPVLVEVSCVELHGCTWVIETGRSHADGDNRNSGGRKTKTYVFYIHPTFPYQVV